MSAFSKLALREFEFESATPIQSLVWPALASANRDVLFGAETGSGKSLAYLVPLMLRVKQLEVASSGSGSSSGVTQEGGALGMRPRAVVVVPTRELVTQVTTVAKRLAHVYKLRIRSLSAAHSERVEANALVSRASAVAACDLLVTTPGRFAAHRASRSLFVSEIAFAAFDEADVLCDRGFRADLDRIVTPLLAKRTRDGATACQFSMCGATLTNELRLYARQTFGSRLTVIETPSLHHSVASARHEFLSVDRQNKLKTLTRVVRACRANGEVALVFCGSVDSCRFVAHEFDEASLPHVSLHAQLPPHDRTLAMRRIAAGDVNGVIVATDVIARGLDLAYDEPITVVLFDFPTSPSDYLHRAGRTARNGASGRVVSLVGSRDVELATQIERCVRERRPLTEIRVSAPSMYHASHNELDPANFTAVHSLARRRAAAAAAAAAATKPAAALRRPRPEPRVSVLR
jgi:superfamily II DNA/RNA helicase